MNSRAMMWVVLVAVRVYDPETKGLLNSRNWVTEDDNCSFELQRFFFLQMSNATMHTSLRCIGASSSASLKLEQ